MKQTGHMRLRALKPSDHPRMIVTYGYLENVGIQDRGTPDQNTDWSAEEHSQRLA